MSCYFEFVLRMLHIRLAYAACMVCVALRSPTDGQ